MKTLLALLVLVTSLEAGPFRRRVQPTPLPTPFAPVVVPAGTDAIDEVNQARARRGLRPFIKDAGLTAGALAVAKYRAERRIHGHAPNDFSFLPAGSSASAAGCGALEPSWGWGACTTYENYTYAGAAVVMGPDGRRYMHIFVR